MPLDKTKEKLVKVLSSKLKDLAFVHDYPLSRVVAIHAFYDGLRSLGADVELCDASQTMTVTWGLVDRKIDEIYNYETVLRFDEILEGRGSTVGTLSALNGASTRLFDEIRYAMPRNYNGARWNFNLNGLNARNIRKMTDLVGEEIEERRDAVFLNRLLQEPKTYVSNLVLEVIGRYDLELYERALDSQSSGKNRKGTSPWPHQLLKASWNSFKEDDLPSPQCVEQFFWGCYLHDIARLKGYESDTKPQMLREYLIKNGIQELLPAARMRWGEEAFANR
jgi:hypothetical protein